MSFDRVSDSYPLYDVRFCAATESKYYQGNAKVASCVQHGIEGFRQGPLWEENGRSKIDVEIVSGDGSGITAAQAAKTMRSFLPALTKEDCLTYARVAKEKGDAFFGAKEYLAARQEYGLATCLLGENLWNVGSDGLYWRSTTAEHRALLLRISMEAFRLALTLGQLDLAQSVIGIAAQNCESGVLSDDELVDILVSKGKLATERGQYSRARTNLQAALSSFPNNEKIEDAIRGVKKKQLQKYREDVARMWL